VQFFALGWWSVMKTLAIDNPFKGAPVYFLEETDSTMDAAAALWNEGARPGTVVVAAYQSRGRGRRRERRWESRSGESLLFTLLLDTGEIDFAPGLLPLIAGLGIARFIRNRTAALCEIKWPNDVLVDGRKVSGILCEHKGSALFVGVGLNCAQERFAGAFAATSLRSIGVANYQPLGQLEPVLRSLKDAFCLENPLREVGTALYQMGKSVRVRTGVPGIETDMTGRIAGIGNAGQLLIEGPDGVVEIFSGELVQPPVDRS
jgi:BirA family biotin operon repressor/biotin-[acetyl-CoA-carboxylase] ligase